MNKVEWELMLEDYTALKYKLKHIYTRRNTIELLGDASDQPLIQVYKDLEYAMEKHLEHLGRVIRYETVDP